MTLGRDGVVERSHRFPCSWFYVPSNPSDPMLSMSGCLSVSTYPRRPAPAENER